MTHINYIMPADCRYTIDGENVASLTRGRLRKVAQALNVNPEGVKDAILRRVLEDLRLRNASDDISRLVNKPEAKK